MLEYGASKERSVRALHTLLPHHSIVSHPVPKLANLLLIVVRRQSTRRPQRNRHRRSSTRLHDARNRRSKQHHAVAERELSTVVLVLLNAVACRHISKREEM